MREASDDDVAYIVKLFKLPHVRRFLNEPGRDMVQASLENPNVENYIIEHAGSPAGNFVLRNHGFLVEFSVLAVSQPQRGAGTFALHWGVRRAYDGLKAHRVYVEVREDNTFTRALVERMGWVQEGVFRDGFQDARTGAFRNLCGYGMLAGERLPRTERPGATPSEGSGEERAPLE